MHIPTHLGPEGVGVGEFNLAGDGDGALGVHVGEGQVRLDGGDADVGEAVWGGVIYVYRYV